MVQSKKLRHQIKTKKCSYSGKPISNKEVILVEYALEYVKKQGYYVTPFKIK